VASRAEIIEFFDGMLGKKEFFIPLTAAQHQFPNHYYGLTSAALLEDLFVDAAINFQKSDRRSVEISRPERKTSDDVTDAKGEKGWDYRFQGEHYSHKVGKDIGGIALLWDSTFKLPPDRKYSYPSPIVFVLSQYKNKNGKLTGEKDKVEVTPISHYRGKELQNGQHLIICQKKNHLEWSILESLKVESESINLNKFLPLEVLWDKMMDYWAGGIPVNQIELFVTKKRKKSVELLVQVTENARIEFVALPGIYLFPKSELQSVVVEKNNRGVLLPKQKVSDLIQHAYEMQNFVYIPNWYSAYAGSRNVDLYQAQRIEYDNLISAVRR
jgi:hypothetical protein